MPANRNYEIKEVAELTGLAPARLRAWERRYKVVRPRRLANRYRVYSSEQVALLRAFARLIASGERIGVLIQEPVESVLSRAEGSVADGSPLPGMLEALRHLDRERLSVLLEQEHRNRSLESFIRDVILPLGELIGDQWALGKLSVAVEHLASDVVITTLKRELEVHRGKGPVLLAACLQDERHEWGLLCKLVLLARAGWRIRYLGADLPLHDLVEASWTVHPACIAISAADPANVEARLPDLRRLPRLVAPGLVIVMGGQGADALGSRLRRYGFRVGDGAIPPVF
jgi:MerR family transcriptional regulator, light-induced transcriptional regulator